MDSMDVDTSRASPKPSSPPVAKTILGKWMESMPPPKLKGSATKKAVVEKEVQSENGEGSGAQKPADDAREAQLTIVDDEDVDDEEEDSEGMTRRSGKRVAEESEQEETESEEGIPSKEDAKDGDYVPESGEETDGGGRKAVSRDPSNTPSNNAQVKARYQARVQVVCHHIGDKEAFDDKVTAELMKRVAANPKAVDRPKLAKLQVENNLAQKWIQLLEPAHRVLVVNEVEELALEILEAKKGVKEEEKSRKEEVARKISVAKQVRIHLGPDPEKYLEAEERSRRAAHIKVAERWIEDEDAHLEQIEVLMEHKTRKRPAYAPHQELLREIVEAALAMKIIEKLPKEDRDAAEEEVKGLLKFEKEQAKMEIDPGQLAHAARRALVAVAASYRNSKEGVTSDTILTKYDRSDEQQKRKTELIMEENILATLDELQHIEARKEIDSIALATVKQEAFKKASASFFKQPASTSKSKASSSQLCESSAMASRSGSDDEESLPENPNTKRQKSNLTTPSIYSKLGKRKRPVPKKPKPKVTVVQTTRPRRGRGRLAKASTSYAPPSPMESGAASNGDGDWGNFEDSMSPEPMGEIAELRRENARLKRMLARSHLGDDVDSEDGI